MVARANGVGPKLAERIVRELPNVDVTFDAAPNHQVKLSSGGSNFRIMGIGREDFPPLAEIGDEKAYSLEQGELAGLAMRTEAGR